MRCKEILIDCVNFIAIIAKILFVISMKKKKSNDCQANINHKNFIIMNHYLESCETITQLNYNLKKYVELLIKLIKLCYNFYIVY